MNSFRSYPVPDQTDSFTERYLIADYSYTLSISRLAVFQTIYRAVGLNISLPPDFDIHFLEQLDDQTLRNNYISIFIPPKYTEILVLKILEFLKRSTVSVVGGSALILTYNATKSKLERIKLINTNFFLDEIRKDFVVFNLNTAEYLTCGLFS